MGYIYLITNIINDKKYVGKTVQSDPYVRWKQHIQYAKSDRITKLSSVHTMPIIRALKKYGVKNFKFEVILKCDEKDINLREEECIKKYDSYYNGYNCTFGGEGIRKDPEQWSNHPHSKPVTCWSLDGNYICDYETTGVALVETLGRKPQKSERGCIKACCQGKTFQSHNYRWTWKGEPLKEWKDKQIRLRHKIYGYNQKGEYKEWESQSKCAEFIEGDIRNNNGVFQSIKSPRKNKLQCKGWYLFHKKGKIIPFDKITFASRGHSTDICKKAAEASAIKRRKPVRATSILTGETLTFKSISEASFYITGQGNYAATGNISLNIRNRENGQHWKFAYNHKWDYC